MIETTPDSIHNPLVVFLRDILHSLVSPLLNTTHDQRTLIDALRRELQRLLHSLPPDSALLPFMLSSCQMIPHLGPETLTRVLADYAWSPARFMSDPPSSFDSVLV